MFKRIIPLLLLALLTSCCLAEAIAPEQEGEALTYITEGPAPTSADAGWDLSPDLPDATEMPVVEDSAMPVLDDQEDAVREAQRGLANLGYYSDSVDGKFGKHTEAALRSFQRQSGLTETGHLDEYTHALLSQYAAENINAKSIQQRLIDLGYLQGTADGKFGDRSAAAVKIFQRLNGLKATGKTNPETILAIFSDQVVALPEALSAGSKGDEVTMLQNNLRRYGFMDEEADGEYGATTTKAVQAFQQHLIDQGIAVEKTGAASPLTLYCLHSEDYSSYLRDVSPGMTDDEVRRVELRLAALGYMDATADDIFDDYAREALELFQNKADLDVNGVADRRTIDALFRAAAPAADHCAPREIASGDTGLAVRDVEEAIFAGGYMTELPDGKYDAALEKALEQVSDYLADEDAPDHLSRETVDAIQNGLFDYHAMDTSTDADAIRIQRRLYTLYYLEKSGIDGKIGDNTVSALHEFQEANGLPRTHGTDYATISALFSKDAKAKPYAYRIQVSLSRQVVEVWERDSQGEYDLVQTFKCSTGLHDSTPRGIFLKGHPVNRWHYFQKFNCWAQYSYKIVDDIMFHSVIYGSKSESSLRRSSERNLGNPASHGCVRLSVEDAKWLFDHCTRGTAAIVIS